MFRRGFSFFAALLLAVPTSAKSATDSSEPLDIDTRLARAKAIFDKLDEPIDNGGVTRDQSDPNKLAWLNFSNFSNFSNFRNFNNFANFRNFNNFNNFHNAPVRQQYVPHVQPRTPAPQVAPSPVRPTVPQTVQPSWNNWHNVPVVQPRITQQPVRPSAPSNVQPAWNNWHNTTTVQPRVVPAQPPQHSAAELRRQQQQRLVEEQQALQALKREQQKQSVQRQQEVQRTDALRKAEAEQQKAREQAAKQAEEIRRKAETEARTKAQAEARRAESEAKRKMEAEVAQRAAEAKRLAAESEARRKADEVAKKTAEAEAKRKLEADAKQRAEDVKRLAAEAETRRKADDAAKKAAQSEVKRNPEQSANPPSAPPASPVYTFSKTPSGTVQISQNGKIIATTTPEYAAQQYGYKPNTAAAPLGSTPGPIGTPVEIGRPVIIGKPVEIGKAVEIGKPVVIGTPVDIGKPVAIGKPVTIGVPVNIGKAVTTGTPVAAGMPAAPGQPTAIGANKSPQSTPPSAALTPVQIQFLKDNAVGLKPAVGNATSATTSPNVASNFPITGQVTGFSASYVVPSAPNALVQSGQWIVKNSSAIGNTAGGVSVTAKALGSLVSNPAWKGTLQSVDKAGTVVSTSMSAIDTYQAYKSGDTGGVVMGSLKTGAGIASLTKLDQIIPGMKLLSPVVSMSGTARDLGTALGTGDKLGAAAAGFELVGKGAAAGAGYLWGGTQGANAAVKAADVALAGGKALGDKVTDTQLFKSATDGWLHIKTNEDLAAEYQRQIDALRARRK